MIYRLKYAKSESNFDADFEHPTCKGKSFKKLLTIYKAFALTGRLADCLYTQGVALGWELLPLQGVLLIGASGL